MFEAFSDSVSFTASCGEPTHTAHQKIWVSICFLVLNNACFWHIGDNYIACCCVQAKSQSFCRRQKRGGSCVITREVCFASIVTCATLPKHKNCYSAHTQFCWQLWNELVQSDACCDQHKMSQNERMTFGCKRLAINWNIQNSCDFLPFSLLFLCFLFRFFLFFNCAYFCLLRLFLCCVASAAATLCFVA